MDPEADSAQTEGRIYGYYQVHGTVEKTIEAIEKTIAWRRDRNMYDIDAFAKEVEDEVSTGEQWAPDALRRRSP